MQVDSTGGVYFLLAFDGLFTPWWRDDARGVCIGITRFMNRFHIARAVRESMCFQVKNLLDSMHKDAGEKGEVKNEKGEFLLRGDGGATVKQPFDANSVHLFPHIFCYKLNFIAV
ncbi:Glycerol kinase [Camellia lanceoleosa]|uniref:Glycerol kinase n=1 Tax=Camellia lanceoleosa TaxID=1840588 RepID=A0ACC0FAI3_9ERIC|nr:Glycerol kinase [Camellia lanceoleosa]